MTHIPQKYRVDGGCCEDAGDGICGGQGRTASSLRDGYVGFCVAVVAILCILGIALYLGWR